MNELTNLSGTDQVKMTVREIANVLGVTERTIQNYVKDLFPEIVIHGEKTFLNEIQTTILKNELKKNYSLRSENVFAVETKEDRKNIVLKAMEILRDENLELVERIKILEPKAESFDVLMRSDKNMSITDCAKHFSLHPKTEVFPWLRRFGYLTTRNLPTVKAISEKVLSLKDNIRNDGVVIPQAVVDVSSLDIWKNKIVYRILSEYRD